MTSHDSSVAAPAAPAPAPAAPAPAPRLVDPADVRLEIPKLRARADKPAIAALAYLSEEVPKSVAYIGDQVVVVFDRCHGVESQQGIRTVVLRENVVTLELVAESFAKMVRKASVGTGHRDVKSHSDAPRPESTKRQPVGRFLGKKVWRGSIGLHEPGYYLASRREVDDKIGVEPVSIGPFERLGDIDKFLANRRLVTDKAGLDRTEKIFKI